MKNAPVAHVSSHLITCVAESLYDNNVVSTIMLMASINKNKVICCDHAKCSIIIG